MPFRFMGYYLHSLYPYNFIIIIVYWIIHVTWSVYVMYKIIVQKWSCMRNYVFIESIYSGQICNTLPQNGGTQWDLLFSDQSCSSAR